MLRERMNGHRSSVKNKADTLVAVHFTYQGSKWRVTVLEGEPSDIVQRRLRKAVNKQAEGSQIYMVLNHGDSLVIQVL